MKKLFASTLLVTTVLLFAFVNPGEKKVDPFQDKFEDVHDKMVAYSYARMNNGDTVAAQEAFQLAVKELDGVNINSECQRVYGNMWYLICFAACGSQAIECSRNNPGMGSVICERQWAYCMSNCP